MDNIQKLESLKSEYEATMNHANEILNEIIATAFEQAVIDVFNELTQDEQMALIFGLLCENVDDIIAEELTAVAEAIEKAAQEEEMKRYEEERREEFIKELNAIVRKLA